MLGNVFLQNIRTASGVLDKTILRAPTLDTLHPLHTTIDAPKLHNSAIYRFACQCQLLCSPPPPSAVMACTRSMTHQSMAIPLPRPTSTADRHNKSAKRPPRPILPQFDLPPVMYFNRVRMDFDTAKENIRRLPYQGESATLFFHSRYDSPSNDLTYRLTIKVGVC
jgi:hypothetical protein